MEIYLENNTTITNSLFLILTIGVIFFAMSVIVMVILFGWSVKDTTKNLKTLAIFLFMSFAVPYGTFFIHQNITSTQAYPSVNLQQLEVVDLDDGTVLMQFKTENETMVYLELTDRDTGEKVPVLPTSNLQKRKEHSFILAKGKKGKEAAFIVDGERYYIDNEPYLIE